MDGEPAVLKDWSFVSSGYVFCAPDSPSLSLQGYVHGHPKIVDGKLIMTSAVKDVVGFLVVTENTAYKLRDINHEYLGWLLGHGYAYEPWSNSKHIIHESNSI
jgi:hypothetical protein